MNTNEVIAKTAEVQRRTRYLSPQDWRRLKLQLLLITEKLNRLTWDNWEPSGWIRIGK